MSQNNSLIKSNKSLKNLTTFKIGGRARFFACVNNSEDLDEALNFAEKNNLPIMVLGSGSNVLVSDRGFPGLVIQMNNKGICIVGETSDTIRLKIESGEILDEVVEYAVRNNYWGIENLSHVPGKMGAFVFQNVGCYGQDASGVVTEVSVFDTKNKETRVLSKQECGFGYRESVINISEKGRYVVLYITIELKKRPQPNISYFDLREAFKDKLTPEIGEIRKTLIALRDSKFPFPTQARNGNVGSFFKNLILNVSEFENLWKHFENNLPMSLKRLDEIKNKFPVMEGIKIPSAFIIDVCGIKGETFGGAKVCDTHALVILNATGTATADDVLGLVKKIKNLVMEKTGIYLYVEPELVGFTRQELHSYGFNDSEVNRFVLN